MRFNFLRNSEWKEALAVFVLFVLLGTLIAAEGCSFLKSTEGGGNKTGSSANAEIDFTAKNLDGQDVKLSDFRGKVVLVNFWAIWCGPCQEEIPELVTLYNNYRDKGFVVLGVSDPSDLKDIKSFVAAHQMDYPIVIDQGPISDEYNVVGFPTSVLIDRNGNIIKKYSGYSPNVVKRIEFQIQKLM